MNRMEVHRLSKELMQLFVSMEYFVYGSLLPQILMVEDESASPSPDTPELPRLFWL